MVFFRTPTVVFWVQTTTLPYFVKQCVSKFIIFLTSIFFIFNCYKSTHSRYPLMLKNLSHADFYFGSKYEKHVRGVSRIFERGGPISLGSLKKRSSDFKRGGSNGLRGGVQYICLTRTTNLAYLDAKEWNNMYFEPLISVKCCPKLHIKQLRNNLHYICL